MRISVVVLLLALATHARAQSSCPGVPGFKYAAFGDADVQIGGGASTDSYDSSVGGYAVTGIAANGNVGTGSTAAGAVKLNGASTTVNGNIDVGFGGTPATVITVAGGASYTSSAAMSAALPLTPIAIPVVGVNLGNVTASGAVVPLAPDNTYGIVKGKAGGTLVFSSGTYVIDQLQLVGGATISVTGSAIVYITSDLDIAGGGVVNPTQKATDLVFFGGPGLTSVKVTGGATAAYAIYAPNADIKTSGGAAIFGSLVGKTIKNIGGSTLHYDRALGAYNDGPFACALEISRASPIVATISAQNTIVQGTFEYPSGSKRTIAAVADVATFAFPYEKGHMRARTSASITTTSSAFSAGTVLFDAAAGIPAANNAGCGAFDGSCRNVFTVTQAPAASGVSLHPPRVELNDTTSATIGALIAPLPGFGAAEWQSIVRKIIAGALGGVDRSTVAVIGPSAVAGSSTRPTIVYFGATDGMLHAACASSGGACPALGTELWAFMPRTQLPLVRLNNARVDGSVRVVDAFGDFANPPTGTRSFHTILTFQTGSTPDLYAIDVTDPTNPIVLWEATTPAAPAAQDLGIGLTIASGPVLTGASAKNIVFAETNNGGTGGTGVFATARALETGAELWRFGYAYPSPPRGNPAHLPLPTTGIPGGAVTIDLLRTGFITDIVMGDLYGNLWRLDAATGTSRNGAGTPLFRFSTNKHPIGALPAIYSDGNQQFAVFGSGGYADPLLAAWSAGTQSLIALSLVAPGPYPLTETSAALAFREDLGAGESVYSQVLVVGDELFVSTDTGDVNLATYGTFGDTGHVVGYNLTTSGSTSVVVRGGASSLASSSTTLYSSSSDKQQQLVATAASAVGFGVDSMTLAQMRRRLWLQTE